MIRTIAPDLDAGSTSFFDVFYHVSLPGLGMEFKPAAPYHMPRRVIKPLAALLAALLLGH